MPKFSIIIPTYNRVSLLKKLVDSISNLGQSSEEYEIIIVNDGSTDETNSYLDGLEHESNIKVVHQENAGPTTARNSGAKVASGEILVFVDDDCTVPSDWLTSIENSLVKNSAALIGGANKNLVDEKITSRVYQQINAYFQNKRNSVTGKASYLMTNNMACWKSTFEKYSGFDERFSIGGEDREFAIRLINAGEKVVYEPGLFINHYHSFSFISFLFQFYRFGRGSHLLFNVVDEQKLSVNLKTSKRDFYELFRMIGKSKKFIIRFFEKFLFLLSQVFAFVGFYGAKWEGIKDLRRENSESSKTAGTGKFGTILGLFSFVGGNAFSSAFGFVSFIILGRALSVSDFGTFMIAFSYYSIVSAICSFGISGSVFRYAAEYYKKKDYEESATILKSGLLLQLIILSVVLFLTYISFDLINQKVFSVNLDSHYLIAIMFAAFSATVSGYFSNTYVVRLELFNLTLLGILVSISRLILIILCWIFFGHSPLLFFWAFIIPFALGGVITFPKYYKTVANKGKVLVTNFNKLIRYASWGTFSGLLGTLKTYSGSLFLAAYVSGYL